MNSFGSTIIAIIGYGCSVLFVCAALRLLCVLGIDDFPKDQHGKQFISVVLCFGVAILIAFLTAGMLKVLA
jgi:glycerol uptake facilitator-like aquaporin